MIEFVATFVVPFVLVLTLIVTVHELGHFWAARAFGVKIDSFSIGFGRALLRFRDRTGVEWRVGWLPLGGYVKFAGDANAASVPDSADLAALKQEIEAEEGPGAFQKYFHFKPLWQRAIVVAAGPVSNFLLAIVIFASLALAMGPRVYPSPRIDAVEPGSPAAHAGFKPGDVVRKVNGRSIEDFDELRMQVWLRRGETVRFSVERDGRPIELRAVLGATETVDPVTGTKTPVGSLGVRRSPTDVFTVRYGPISALKQGVNLTVETLDTTLVYLGRVLTGRESADALGGPLGIARTSGAVASAAAEAGPDLATKAVYVTANLLNLAAFLSVGIGFMNLLPVPVLDGGHLLFYGYEAVARRPLDERIQAAGYWLGLALLLGLMLFVTWNDLKKLPLFQQVGGLLS
ncbi:M50 family metallopeptidase [Caulobacter sp. 17J65-9]|uniref:M50 family metallopeptidase n=1 Tax=Caulobacter sp. 17J65-9 TaxID=2709382 RepID=UPI0013CBC4A6|nr:M50 family metallopeptidase [Caulobacter sp. 17J65-9]NEX94346.1 PDZ domain-containing protein [Caulobacter sp. 17J65-9]